MVFFVTIGQTQQWQNLMPVPNQLEVTNGRYSVTKQFNVSIQGSPNDRIYPEATRFMNRLGNKTGLFFEQGFLTAENTPSTGDFIINVAQPGSVKFGEEESYTLGITEAGISLTAKTDIGAMRGLETLLQLLSADKSGYYFPLVSIKDSPRFLWRGLMIDVARHFQPVGVIKRNIDAMAAVKMNVLHLHLSDDQGFRVESKEYPKLTLMGSDGFFYTQDQIKDIVKYADQRGIRVYPEFDVPGHATTILTAYPEFASKKETYGIERNAGVFDPTIDPSNPKSYVFINALFTEMASLFTDEYFHIGGDENEGKHWDENENIQAFMKENNLKDNHALQSYFNKQLLKNLEKINKKMIGWDEIMHDDLPKTAIIQSWRGLSNMQKAAKSGYKTMLSNGFYIDLMHNASEHYLIEPLPDSLNLTEKEKERIIGGEATIWSELVTSNTIDSRIWPRTAAIAERLWSRREVRDVDDMYRRLSIISIQLEQLGIKHLTMRDRILRSMVNQFDIKALQVLVNVCQPLQGYTRNPGGTMYQSYSPFMLFADACSADPQDAYRFDKLVDGYFGGEVESLAEIKNFLSSWVDNHKAFEGMQKRNPLLDNISKLSANLSELSSLGLVALQMIAEDRDPVAEWEEESKEIIEKAREQGGRTELQVVDAIERLILASFAGTK